MAKRKKGASEPQTATAKSAIEPQPGMTKAAWNPSHDTRFRKGNPGGPGRPKGSKNLATIINQALSAKVTIKANGKALKASKLEIMAMQMVKKGTEGDLKAIEKAFALCEKYAPAEKQSEIAPEQSAYELDVLSHHFRMRGMLKDPDTADEDEIDDEDESDDDVSG